MHRAVDRTAGRRRHLTPGPVPGQDLEVDIWQVYARVAASQTNCTRSLTRRTSAAGASSRSRPGRGRGLLGVLRDGCARLRCHIGRELGSGSSGYGVRVPPQGIVGFGVSVDRTSSAAVRTPSMMCSPCSGPQRLMFGSYPREPVLGNHRYPSWSMAPNGMSFVAQFRTRPPPELLGVRGGGLAGEECEKDVIGDRVAVGVEPGSGRYGSHSSWRGDSRAGAWASAQARRSPQSHLR